MKRGEWKLAFTKGLQLTWHILVLAQHCLPQSDACNDILLKVILSPFSDLKKKKKQNKAQRKEGKLQCHRGGQLQNWNFKMKNAY